MAKQKQKNASWLAVLMISMLSLGSFAFTYSTITGNSFFSIAQAKDGEDDDGGGDDDSGDNSDEDKNDDKGGSKKEKKSKSEAVKKAK